MGKVVLVGAGPGDPELITLAGHRALSEADVVLADALLPSDFLERITIPTKGKHIERVGRHGESHWSQDEICRELARHAKAGKYVVRLKGGDPMVFGRAVEEIEHLAREGVPCEVLPGVTASIAAAELAGFPLTRRGDGRSFAVVTARLVGGELHTVFPRSDTLVVLMGAAVVENVADRLAADGWGEDTSAAIVERGSLHWERRVTGTLSTIAFRAREASVASPAVLVVGDGAAGLASEQRRPTVLFTGLDPSGFRSLGRLLHWPALRLEVDEAAAARMASVVDRLRESAYQAVLFTDKTAVDFFLRALGEHETDARVFGAARLIAAKDAVAERMAWRALRADSVLASPNVEAGARHFSVDDERPVLIVAGTHLPGELVARITAEGAACDPLVLHRVAPHPELGRPLPEHDAVYFVSPNGVKAFHAAYGASAFQRKVWSLGPAVQASLAKLGVESEIVVPRQLESAADLDELTHMLRALAGM